MKPNKRALAASLFVFALVALLLATQAVDVQGKTDAETEAKSDAETAAKSDAETEAKSDAETEAKSGAVSEGALNYPGGDLNTSTEPGRNATALLGDFGKKCQECHGRITPLTEPFILESKCKKCHGAEGPPRIPSPDSAHRTHSNRITSLVSGSSADGDCFDCHQRGGVDCQRCHKLHPELEPGGELDNESCTENCHGNLPEPLGHNSKRGRFDSSKHSWMSDCSTCHSDGSVHRFEFKDISQYSRAEVSDFCKICHSKDAEKHDQGQLEAFTCPDCHNPHRTNIHDPGEGDSGAPQPTDAERGTGSREVVVNTTGEGLLESALSPQSIRRIREDPAHLVRERPLPSFVVMMVIVSVVLELVLSKVKEPPIAESVEVVQRTGNRVTLRMRIKSGKFQRILDKLHFMEAEINRLSYDEGRNEVKATIELREFMSSSELKSEFGAS